MPTVKDIFNYVINEPHKKLDRHFLPQISIAHNLCRDQYDMIGKTEAYEQDMTFLMQSLGMEVNYKHW